MTSDCRPKKRCHSDDRKGGRISWIGVLRVRCFTAVQHDKVFFLRFLTCVRNDIRQSCGRVEASPTRNILSLYAQMPISCRRRRPAFIGLPGAREKAERGRGLFEQSEFRSPVDDRCGRQEYPITSGRPFLVTSLRRERSNRQLSF